MFVRRCFKNHLGKRHAYWALVETVRTAHGPRQWVVAYLGDHQTGRLGMHKVAAGICGTE